MVRISRTCASVRSGLAFFFISLQESRRFKYGQDSKNGVFTSEEVGVGLLWADVKTSKAAKRTVWDHVTYRTKQGVEGGFVFLSF